MVWTEESIKKNPVLSGIVQIFSANELGVIDTVDSPGLRWNTSSCDYECSEDWTWNLEKAIGEKA